MPRNNWKAKFYQLEAQHEALRCELDAMTLERDGERREAERLSAELMRLQTTHHDAVTIRNRGELMQVMRKLSAEGVPCIMRGGFIYHSMTKAVLAQIGVNR